jgi:hypothetical protein
MRFVPERVVFKLYPETEATGHLSNRFQRGRRVNPTFNSPLPLWGWEGGRDPTFCVLFFFCDNMLFLEFEKKEKKQ